MSSFFSMFTCSDRGTAVVEGTHVGSTLDNRYGINSGHDADPATTAKALHR